MLARNATRCGNGAPESAHRSPAGEHCATSPNRRPSTLRDAATAELIRPRFLGVAFLALERLAFDAGHRQARYSRGMVPKSVLPILDVEVPQGQNGRPAVTREVRDLIRRMSRENTGWGAPRIHGELLKVGIDIGETSVS